MYTPFHGFYDLDGYGGCGWCTLRSGRFKALLTEPLPMCIVGRPALLHWFTPETASLNSRLNFIIVCVHGWSKLDSIYNNRVASTCTGLIKAIPRDLIPPR